MHFVVTTYIAVLVAGDVDYVLLVQAVQAEGRGVHLWFIQDGLSPKLLHAVDHFSDIGSTPVHNLTRRAAV